MGYKRPQKVYVLNFEDKEFEGLVVKAKSTSMEDFLAIQRGALRLQENKEVVLSDIDIMEDLFGRFSQVLVEWNLEDDKDQPIPASKSGLLAQDPEFVLAIIEAWIGAAGGGVDESLGKDSQNGGLSPEAADLMAALSRNLGS